MGGRESRKNPYYFLVLFPELEFLNASQVVPDMCGPLAWYQAAALCIHYKVQNHKTWIAHLKKKKKIATAWSAADFIN